jgi:4-hydroxybenzoate polyprenyltransferase
MTLAQRLSLYLQLTRLNRPIGILLLLWPTLWGVWIAGAGHPAGHIVLIFLLGTVLMRSAGCAFNDYADRDFDRYVKRTSERPVTSGRISPGEAVWVGVCLSLFAFVLILPLNNLTLLLSFPAVFLAASYPFTKRFLAIPQAYLGIAFGFGIPMAFAAQLGSVPAVAWLLLVANVFWAIAYGPRGRHPSRHSLRGFAVRQVRCGCGDGVLRGHGHATCIGRTDDEFGLDILCGIAGSGRNRCLSLHADSHATTRTMFQSVSA